MALGAIQQIAETMSARKARLKAEREAKVAIREERPVPQKSSPNALDATPERIAMDESEMINPAEIDSSEQPIGYTRRFRSSYLDRLYRKDDPKHSRLTWEQWNAGNWYRNTHARCGFTLSVVASYGERTSFGERSFGLARTEAQVNARLLWKAARKVWPAHMAGYMDRFLVHDALPRYGGSAHARSIRDIASALQLLADWMRDVSPYHIIEEKRSLTET